MPFIPLVDEPGNEGTVPPAQIVRVVPKLNTGTMIGSTVTDNDVGTAHNPGLGVKVYVPDVVLLIVDGLQVPAIPLVELVGSTGAVAPLQIEIEVPNANAGVTLGFTVTANVNGFAH